ncbi:transglycosylase family protein [Streptomyces sp. NPDC046977]|uniref:transglycosylase family protein n=1 Tax=Streptomyces sp. NPDC046977 TaxID=3154703 RepID=UPI0033CEB91F
MLKSGNGRHRKPRQAPTAMVAVAATGAGLTLPLFAASGASAADAGTSWNAVAACESGGLWSSNTGNGFYGGLQITEETWQQYGGTVYAERPDLASRNEQITVAEKILSVLGPDAWSGCADQGGLGEVLQDLLGGNSDGKGNNGNSNGDENGSDSGTDTGSDHEDAGTDGSSDGTGTGTGTDSGTDATAGSSDSGDDSTAVPGSTATPDPETSTGTAAKTPGKHRKPEADTTPRLSGRTTGTGSGSHGVTSVPPQIVEGDAAWGAISRDTTRGADERSDRGSDRGAAKDTSTKDTGDGRYVVQEGDSLCGIAMEQGLPGGWRGLYAANKDVIGDNPDRIVAGETLELGRR